MNGKNVKISYFQYHIYNHNKEKEYFKKIEKGEKEEEKEEEENVINYFCTIFFEMAS